MHLKSALKTDHYTENYKTEKFKCIGVRYLFIHPELKGSVYVTGYLQLVVSNCMAES